MDVGLAIVAFVLVFLALALMFMALMFKRPAIAWSSMLPWIVFGFFIKTQLSTADYDIYYWIFWLCVLGLPLLCMTEALLLRPKKVEDKQDFYPDEADQMAKDWEVLSSPSIPRLRSRGRYKAHAEQNR
jgi:magnesium-transporting ATPase (P-type)